MKIAVVGSGISGLAAAWLLSTRHAVTLFESEPRPGGHTHTVDVQIGTTQVSVDTGFLVFNRVTYPNLVALFEALQVPVVASDMSLSVSLLDEDIEWCGSTLGSLFVQPRNLVRPRFLGMLRDVLRFNRVAGRAARAGGTPGAEPVGPGFGDEITAVSAARATGPDDPLTLGQFLDREGFGSAFRDWYLLPMAGAIWSCPTETMLEYPWLSFARFCANHGLLQITHRPQWYTVAGGARGYVERLLAVLTDVRCGTPVRQVLPLPAGPEGRASGVHVRTDQGTEWFDQVVFACHSDQALALLPQAGADLRKVLSAFGWQANEVVLHTDTALLPRRRGAWAAWNYLAGRAGASGRPVGVSYLINRLQPLSVQTPVIVTLNPPQRPDGARVLRQLTWHHPVFGPASAAAQRALPALQGRDGLWFAGAWTGHGFHEDGLRSALVVANRLGVRAPWQSAGVAHA